MKRMFRKEDQGEEQRGQDDLAPLLAASQAVNAAITIEDALRVVLGHAKSLLGAHEGSVMLLDQDGFLRIVASDGIPPEVIASSRIAPGEGIAGRVAMTGRAELIAGQADEQRFTSFVHKDRALRSAISVPLAAGGRTVGVLNLNITHGDRNFDEPDMKRALIFAEHAAMVIHKAQMFEDARNRADELSLLLESGRSFAGILEIEPLLNGVLDAAMRLTSTTSGLICIYDEQLQRVSVAVYRGIQVDQMVATFGHPGFLQLLRGDPVVVRPTGQVPPLQGLAPPENVSVISAFIGENATRVLMTLFAPAGTERVSVYPQFVTQASLAIRSAQMYGRLNEKESELASIIYSMPTPVIVADADGKLSVANPAAETQFGFSTSFARGQNIAGLLGNPELEDLLINPVDRTIEVGGGSGRIWKARSSKIESSGDAAGRILVLDDITSQHQTERLKADFVAIIGHELRTPLTLIRGFVKTLMRNRDALSKEQVGEALTTVDAQGHRLERLIEDLLYVSGIEGSRPPLHLQDTDLVALTHTVVAEFQARDPGRPFEVNGPADVQIRIDRTKIEQVIHHLIDNASKYSDASDPISIEISEDASSVHVSISDKGIGILSGDIPAIFELFYQVDTSTTRTQGGTGVGLYICKSMVEAHAGRLKVESAWGQGSTFRFTIPKDISSAKAQQELSSQDA